MRFDSFMTLIDYESVVLYYSQFTICPTVHRGRNMNICAQSVGVATDKRAQRHAYLQRQSVLGNSIRGGKPPCELWEGGRMGWEAL